MKMNVAHDDIARWALATAVGGKKRYKEFLEGDIDVTLTINGEEFDFVLVMNAIDKRFRRAVATTAGMQYVDRFKTVCDDITKELCENLKRLKQIRAAEFPEISDAEWLKQEETWWGETI